MTQFPILSGIYADTLPQLRTSYPVNYRPVPKDSGINTGYLQPAEGLELFASGPGVDRGGINWNGVCYRVMGSKLVSVASDGTVTTIGDVGNDGSPATFDYSFDRLGIASGGNLFYLQGGAISQVTDPDLGTVVDMIWVDGYFMTTDGEFLVVTELTNPFDVNPLKYGSSEADPDPIVGLLKIRNEVVALNRYTIEYFDNVGGDLFPFARIEGAQIEKGAIGTHACAVMTDVVAFMGGGFNESISVYAGANGQAAKLATQEIDDVLAGYTEAQLSGVVLEMRRDGSHELLYVHLPDKCLVYDSGASQALGQPVWYVLSSGEDSVAQYRARFLTRCYDKWIGGDPAAARLCTLSDTTGHHYGTPVYWEFGTTLVYNESLGAIFHEMELVALTGSVGDDATIATNYSVDGVAWSMDKVISAGEPGERTKRLVWYRQGAMRNWRTQRFHSNSNARIAPVRLEARLEPLNA